MVEEPKPDSAKGVITKGRVSEESLNMGKFKTSSETEWGPAEMFLLQCDIFSVVCRFNSWNQYGLQAL